MVFCWGKMHHLKQAIEQSARLEKLQEMLQHFL